MSISSFKNLNFWMFPLLGLVIQSCASSKKYVIFSSDNQGQKMYNVPYGIEGRQKMDVFLPPVINSHPMVILVHGGAWKYGDKSHLRQIQNFLFKNQIPTAAINYRLVNKKINYKNQLEDISLAIQKINFESNNWSVRPNHFILLGESAGGHLALVYGYTHTKEILKIISLSGPTDFFSSNFLKTTYSKLAMPTIEKVVGEKMNRENPSEKFLEASPISLVNNVPTLLFQGGNDFLVPKSQAFALDSVLAAKDIPHKLVFMKNAGHAPRLTDPETRDSIIYPAILDWIKNN
jgi:acetyl esterase/lipase